jgi:hypothetical protein
MIGALIGFIILLLVAGFLLWAVQQLIGLVPLAEPFATLVRIALYGIVLLVVIWGIVYLLGLLGVAVPFHGPALR